MPEKREQQERRPTDTFAIEFDTVSMPGKIIATTVTLRREIVPATDPNKVFRVDLSDHPLYGQLCRYVRNNRP